MSLNKEDYRHYIAPLALNKDQEDEILEFLYRLFDEVISSAMHKHAVQQSMQTNQTQKNDKGQKSVIESLCPIANQAFEYFLPQAIC